MDETRTEVEIPRSRVYMLNVNPGSVSTRYADSWANALAADASAGLDVLQGRLANISGCNISKGRNELVSAFLRTDGEWAWFVDSDMVFPPDTHLRLLAAAKVTGAKVVGGLCVMVTPDGPIPTLYQHNDVPGPGATRVHLDYPPDTLLQVAATGTACLMVHRDVLEHMRRIASDDFCWFRESVERQHWVSEDIGFTRRSNELGYRVYVDCTLEIGHDKHGRVWTPSDIKRGVGFPQRPTVAVIPVKDRLDLTTDLVHQLRTQGGCDEIVICDNGSGTKTKNWLTSQNDLTVLDCPDMGIHEMWNRGLEHALARHGHRAVIAFLNNDLRLGDQFLARLAQALESDPDLMAVSGNYDGRTHAGLVQYVTDICADRYDGTGGLAGFAFAARGEWFTTGYRFPEACKWWYGDNDLVTAANVSGKKTGIAIAAQVEHIGGGSQTGNWAAMADQLEADRDAFLARWTPPRVVDVFLYSGDAREHDMIRLRQQTLAGHVDAMVAVTCNLTYQGDPVIDPVPPPDGIEWVTVHAEPPPGRSEWGGEHWGHVEGQHRRGIPKALEQFGWPANTVVLVSDVDEIPDPATIPVVAATALHTPVAVPMRMHGFALDYLHPHEWRGTTASRLAVSAPQEHRDARWSLPTAGAGWHLSWLGDLDAKRRKRDTFSHGELADLDVEACWRDGVHANGEQLKRLTRDDVDAMSWPAPLFDGFDTPASWWAPAEVTVDG